MPKPAKSERTFRVCPNCGSRDIQYASMRQDAPRVFVGIGLPEVYYCPDCGYEGGVVLEMNASSRGKGRFPNKPLRLVTPTLPNRPDVETVKPAFTIVVLVFFVFTAFFFANRPAQLAYEQPTTNTTSLANSRSDFLPQLFEKLAVEQEPPIITGPPAAGNFYSIVGEAGISSSAGIMVSLLLIALMVAFAGVMIGHHYQRSLRFI
ncbi:TFIIB-type zinc ribbon-containing protein [Candidatus Micrarchaeota archaeon]|nr:TFIIB-type zinc ribbon-containing protein [Candidatus Micrarchaeota archaeon]